MPKPKPAVSIIERRLQSGTIFGTSSKPIPLVEPKRWSLRIVNSQVSNSHLYDMQAEKGWVYAAPEDLAIRAEEIGFHVLDGRVVRGTQGTEVLMKMERADYQAVQREKDRVNREQTFGRHALKNTLVQAAGQQPDGDQGASFLDQALSRITVKDSRGPEPVED